MSRGPELARRGALVPTVLVLAVLIGGFLVFTELWTEKLWFDAVNYPQVFSTQLLARLGLFTLFFLGAAGSVALNMWIAYKFRPTVRRSGRSAVLDRYRDLLEENVGKAILIPAGFFGVLAGMSGISNHLEYLT